MTKKLEKLKEFFVKKMNEADKKSVDENNVLMKKYYEEELKEEFKPTEYTDYSSAFYVQDGAVRCTSENGHDVLDYYGEYRGGYPWVNPVLEKEAKKKGFFWEWQHPGAIVLTE
jgi:hypothetical protein